MRNGHDNTEIDLKTLWRSAPTLVKRGWHPVPIEPNSKACKVSGWTRYCSEAPDAAELVKWADDPRGFGMGLALGRRFDDGSVLVALDGDADGDDAGFVAAFDRIEAAIGTIAAPAKVGRRGRTVFLRLVDFDGSTTKVGHRAHTAENWHFDVLGAGAQSVVPPSIHPTTGKPYRWIEGRSMWPVVGGRPTITPVESLPCVSLGDLIAVLDAEGFDTGNLRRHDTTAPAEPREAVPVVTFEELSDAAVVELLDRLEFDGADLGDLWTNGSDAKVFERRGKTASGNERRHELAYQMRKAGYDFGFYIAALREWKYTVGNKPFDVDDDLSRLNSRLIASWESAGRRLASAASDATEAFGATAVDDDGDAPGGGPGVREKARRTLAKGRSLDEWASAGRRSAPLTLIEGLVGHGHIVECFAGYGVGKTAFVAAAALALATGANFGGRKTDRRAVVIVAYEDADGVVAAVVTGAARMGLDLSQVPIHIVAANDGAALPNLATDTDSPVAAFRSYAAAAEARFGVPVGLIVIDTRGRATVGMKENDPDAASLYNARLASIVAGTGATIWTNSHPAKSGNGETSAGSAKFGNDADDVFSIENKDGVRTVTARKSKGGRFGAQARFDLEVVASAMPVRGPGGEILPPEAWGTVALLHWLSGWGFAAEAGPSSRGKVKPLDPSTLAGEAFAVLDAGGGCVLADLADRVTEARLARGVDVDTSPLAARRLRRSLDSALRKPAAEKWVTQIGGRWFTLDAARMVAGGEAEAD